MTDELGNMLLKAGKISEGQLTKALELHGDGKGKLDEILIRMGVVGDEDELSTFIGKQLNIGAVKLSDIELNPDVVNMIPVDIARKFNVIAVSKINRTLVVAISDPNNIYVLDAVKFITGCNVQPVISPEAAISKAIDSYYIESDGFSEIIRDIEESDLEVIESREDSLSDQDLQSQVQDKPLVKLVDSMVADAIRKGVSDIHIECYEKRIRVRFRKDGKLSEMAPLPFKYRAAIISRVKIMADLDISERRLPQDGRIKVKVAERTVDLRISVLPTIFGEKVVMRILDPKSLMVDMTQLGFEKSSLEAFDRVIHLPFGIILVTGPTGSGKTTTLYSALKQLNTTDVNIMTVEDPVEFNFDGINQVQVRSDIGLTFASSLRSFLRQDPDIIMVGEIRDTETAEIAIRAALTGHLVFATLHTNDAPSTISRLIDMGIPPFLVASSTKLIMAQRMVRLLCKKCKRPGKGCKECGDTGMSGRNGIFEVMPITATLERMILQSASVPELREQACKEEHMLTLRQAAIKKLKAGITNVQEVLATTANDQ